MSRTTVIVIVVLGMLVAALGGVIVAREMSAPTEVALEPVATAGANPFMDSVGTDVPDVRPVANTGGRHSGTTPGLYGGTGDNATCDRSQLTRFLSGHPDRAAGWASVLGLRDGSSSTISSYVDGLTSVVLRSDTYVTNHGWSGGTVTSWPSVLQAGTAVLVDEYGNPVTRCFCGNPLTAPQSFNTVAYVGPRWSSFTSNSVTIVTHQTTNVTNNYTIIDVHTGRGHDRPRGTEGEDDRPNPNAHEAFPDGEQGHPQPGDQQDGDTAHRDAGTGDAGTGTGETGAVENGPEIADAAGTQGSDARVPEDAGTPGPGTTPGTGDPGLTAPGGSTIPDPTTSTTTTTTGATPTAPSGTMTASSSCELGTTSPVFDSDGSYTDGSAAAGRWTLSGDSLTVTPTSTGSPVTFAESGGSWSDGAGCTLTP